jgi:hypothetical protein
MIIKFPNPGLQEWWENKMLLKLKKYKAKVLVYQYLYSNYTYRAGPKKYLNFTQQSKPDISIMLSMIWEIESLHK